LDAQAAPVEEPLDQEQTESREMFNRLTATPFTKEGDRSIFGSAVAGIPGALESVYDYGKDVVTAPSPSAKLLADIFVTGGAMKQSAKEDPIGYLGETLPPFAQVNALNQAEELTNLANEARRNGNQEEANRIEQWIGVTLMGAFPFLPGKVKPKIPGNRVARGTPELPLLEGELLPAGAGRTSSRELLDDLSGDTPIETPLQLEGPAPRPEGPTLAPEVGEAVKMLDEVEEAIDLYPQSNSQRTQLGSSTVPSYEKARKVLGEGKTLDFGAGRGEGAEKIGADTFEPYPRKGFAPTYSSAADIPDAKYKNITSLNVLNVMPRSVRDEAVNDIGRILKPGGKAVVTTRGRDVLKAKGNLGPEPMSIFTTNDTYQKGFTQPELRNYIQGQLGEGFVISNLPEKIGQAGVLIKKRPSIKAADRAMAGRKAEKIIASQPIVKASEALGQLMEQGFNKTAATQSDRTIVGGGNIGGAAFPVLSEADPNYAGKVWGVMDSGTASRLTNLTTPETAWTTMLGAATQLKTNPIVFDKLKRAFVSSMKKGNLSPELAEKININLAVTFGEGADIRDPNIWSQANTFEKRAALADVMMGQGLSPKQGGVALGGEKSGKGVIFKPSEILIKETDKALLHPIHGGDAATFAAGPRMFSLDGSADYRPDLHPGFPTLLGGKDLQVNMQATPTEVYLPDFHRQFKKDNPDRKKPGYYDLTLGKKGEGIPSQNLTDDYIRHLLREGFNEGGEVKNKKRAKT
jgi:SAM-dependent methyltransferase